MQKLKLITKYHAILMKFCDYLANFHHYNTDSDADGHYLFHLNNLLQSDERFLLQTHHQ